MQKRVMRVLFALVCLGVVGFGVWRWWEYRQEQRVVAFIIPAGTAAQLAAGEEVAVLPQVIELRLGTRDILHIQNDDSEPVQIGPYRIDAGQVFRQQFFNAGTFDMMCSLHADEEMRVIVTR